MTVQVRGPGTFDARVGEQVVVRIEESPTTGYQWVVADGHAGLTVEESQFEPPSSAAPGAAGHRVITLAATEPGSHTVRLQRRREWEATAIEECEIVVRALGD